MCSLIQMVIKHSETLLQKEMLERSKKLSGDFCLETWNNVAARTQPFLLSKGETR